MSRARFGRPRRAGRRSGFTLIEVMVAAAVAGFALAATFSFARYQIVTYKTHTEISRMQSSAQVVFESMARDIRNAGFGTTFYAGAEDTAFGGNLAFGGRGVPAIRVANNIPSSQGDVMPGTDAITILRVESESTFIPPSGPGARRVPAEVSATEPYRVNRPHRLAPCALSNPNGGIVLLSDMVHRAEPASMLLPIEPFTGMPDETQPGAIYFRSDFGITIDAVSRADEGNPDLSVITPTGVGLGSLVTCVRPITYWVDRFARLRMWRASTVDSGGNTATVVLGAFGSVPINPTSDIVLAEGVEELQIAYLMSHEAAGLESQWVFASSGLVMSNLTDLAEIRAVRISGIVRTPRRTDSGQPADIPDWIEDRNMTALNWVIGCTDLGTCREWGHTRKHFTYQSELRSMRSFDLMSTTARTTAVLKSWLK